MKYDFLGVVVFGFVFLMGLAVIITFVIVGIFVVKALIRYIKSKDVRKEKSGVKKSLEECKMTQEFVAESIGVSRQAVSKWENGISDPSTSNLIALAKLFKISAEDLLHEVH